MRQLLSFFLLSFFLLGLPSKFVFAAGTCVCSSNDTDCRAVFLPLTQQTAEGCKEACTKDVGKNLALTEFAVSTEGDILAATCQQKHKTFVASKSETTSAGKPPLASITPKLNVDIPGLKFSDPIITATTVKTNFLADYLNAIYAYLIGAAAIIAIVMIMIGGLQYTLGAGSQSAGKGKDRIKNAATGLVLLLCVYLILNTTNPQLVLQKMAELQNVQTIEIPEDTGDVVTDDEITASGKSTSEVRVCGTPEDCKILCAKNKSEWPASNPKTIDEKMVSKAPSSPGFVNDGGNSPKGKGTVDVQNALKKAGQIAQSLDSAYTIHLVSGFRPLTNQIQKVCDIIATGDENKIKGIGKSVAWPGGSNHGSGVAVDVVLMKGNVAMTDPSLNTTNQHNPKYKDGAQLLSQIMDQAGFVRYGKEIWHFELKGQAGSSCRCSYPNCPFPAKC